MEKSNQSSVMSCSKCELIKAFKDHIKFLNKRNERLWEENKSQRKAIEGLNKRNVFNFNSN